jgi:hypothetical protein
MTVTEFLEKHGVKDTPDMPDKVFQMLKKDNLYYIDDDGQGWLVSKDIRGMSIKERNIMLILEERKE